MLGVIILKALEFGWFSPTSGDTTAFGVDKASIDITPEYLQGVADAAEQAGFEYILIPVDQRCWEAYIAGAFMAARSQTIAPLIAARPGYINPVLLAKMISTFDRFSGGRICVNLIAGQAEAEIVAEGIRYTKEDRYALMTEEVSILKALWTADGPLDWDGRFHQLRGAVINPRPLQQPYPKFYLGGGSQEPGGKRALGECGADGRTNGRKLERTRGAPRRGEHGGDLGNGRVPGPGPAKDMYRT